MSLAYSNVRPIRPDKQATDRPEATGKGFALLHRKIMELPFYRTDSDAVHLWIHFILSANHAPGPVSTEFGDLLCRRGEFITGRHTLAQETGIDPNRIKYLLLKFEKLGMISKESNKKFSKILVIKYDDYQKKVVPTDCHQSANAIPLAARAAEEVVPTDCHQSATNNITSNTNVLDSSQRNSLPAVQQQNPQRPEAAIQSPKGDKWGTADDLKAAEWMFDVVKSIEPSARKPAFAGWANDIRLMREKDGRDHRDMCSLFRWASQDSFWCGNVLCPAKLREKWSQLAIKRDKAKSGTGTGKPVLDFNNTDWAEGLQL